VHSTAVGVWDHDSESDIYEHAAPRDSRQATGFPALPVGGAAEAQELKPKLAPNSMLSRLRARTGTRHGRALLQYERVSI
jgi:hypothetical protein